MRVGNRILVATKERMVNRVQPILSTFIFCYHVLELIREHI